jgi:hypothetical protein
LGAQQVKLQHDDNQSDKGAQATDAGTNPMHDFDPHGNFDIILAGDQSRAEASKIAWLPPNRGKIAQIP